MAFSKAVSSELRAYNADIFAAAALPNAAAAFSEPFINAGIMSRTEIVIRANAPFAVGEGRTLVFELYDCRIKSGTFLKSADIVTVAGAKSFAAGDEIARFVPNSVSKHFMKLKVTDSEDLSAGKIDAYLVHKG